MKHFGDITKISGYDVPPVDIITGGSPCQDLSVAGRQAGMSKECENHSCDFTTTGNTELEKCPKCGAKLRLTRSGLFMEQIRIIKEMREKSARTDNNIRPRYMVWENVPGAFSSNKGEDFRTVLEETARIADKTASIPRPKGGQWSTSGCIMGNGWSIAWRVHDAQFWGVPQRRRRIALVADFRGQSAPEILFERKSVRGDFTESSEQRETLTAVTQNSVRASGGDNPIAFHLTQTPVSGEVVPCLSSGNPNSGQCMRSIFQPTYCIQGNCIDRADTAGCNGKGWKEDVSYTLNTIDRPAVVYNSSGNDISGTIDAHYYLGQGARGGKEREYIYDARGNGIGSIAPTITGDHENRITDYTAITFSSEAYDEWKQNETGATLRQSGGIYQGGSENIVAVYCRNFSENDRINGTLQAKSNGGISLNLQNVCRVNSTVRRLTPLECERLQGYPSGWTDIGDWTDSKGKKHKDADSPRYKALGNSIALPFWEWLAKRICAQYGRSTTMASLFDGIGGFPLVFTRAGAKAVWNSEVEPFCEAVTKKRFGEEAEITQKAL